MSEAVQLPIPAKLAPLFTAVNKRYRCSHGGRGSAKTRTFALMTAVKAYQSMMNGESGVVLCAREFMNSLEESSMQEVKQAILSVPWLAANFDIGEKYIRTIDKSVNYVFCGLRHNLDSIKSKARILLCWVDEAESVSEIAWQKLSPTVREEGSEIWVTWNPERDGSATDKRFRKEAGDDCITVEMNYTDNPWFPDVLEGERQNDQRRLDPATYAWVWEGAYLETPISRYWPVNTGLLSSRITSGKRLNACSSALILVSPRTLTRWCVRSSCTTGYTSSTRHTGSRQS